MAETPPKKEAAKAAKEGASPEPFSPSKHSHTNFFSVDGFQVEDDAPPTWSRIRWHTRGHFVLNLLIFI
jgi:hypothetical protein